MRKALILYLLSISFSLTGCWDRVELNDIAIVTGIAIDPGEGSKYRVTLEYVNPSQFSKQPLQQGAPVTTMSLEGNSVTELVRRMNIGVSRKLVFSHTRVLFINEKIAEEGILGFLDSFDRTALFRNDFNILVTKGHKAEDFIKVNNPIERIPSLKVQKQIKVLLQGWGGDPRIRLTDFLNAIASKGRSPVASAIIIKGDPKKGINAESNMSIEQEARTVQAGMSVFKHDKLLGFLTLEDTKNYLWTQNLETTYISYPCSNGKKEKEDAYVDIRIQNSTTKMSAKYINGNPVLKVDLFTEGIVRGMECQKDLTKMETYDYFEKLAQEYITQSVKDTILKVQSDYGTDIFGFGEALNREHHKKFKEVEDKWDKEFVRGDVEVTAKVQLRRSGVRNKSFLTDLPKEAEEE